MAQTNQTDYTYVASGSPDFLVPFPYLSTSEVEVTVDGAPTGVIWTAAQSIQLTPTPTVGALVRVRRNTDARDVRNDFSAGAPFSPRNINENNEQLLYAVEEAVNDTAGTAAAALAQANQAIVTADNAAALIDDALQDSALYLRNDLANSTDPAKGAALIGFRGRTQAARNMDAPSVYDYDGATFQQRLEAGINAGGPLIVPPGAYAIEPFTLSPVQATILLCRGVTFTAATAGQLFQFGDADFEIHDALFDLSAHSGANTNAAVFSDGANRAEFYGVRFFSGAFGARVENPGYVHFERCYGLGALLWHVFASGAQSGNFLYNRVGGGLYDGIKVGGVESPAPARTERRLSIVGNITWGNARDGVDVAVNTAESILIHGNHSYNDALRAVDFKAIYQGSGSSEFLISNNLCLRKGLGGDITAFNIQGGTGEGTGQVRRGTVNANRAYTDSTTQNSASAGIRIADCLDVDVFDNSVSGYYYGARVLGGSVDVSVERNNFGACVTGVQVASDATGTPLRTKVKRNTINITNNLFGITTGGAVVLAQSTDAEIDRNNWAVGNGAYAVQAENIGIAATGTKFGTNYRGYSTSLPTGQRAVVGETWLVPAPGVGQPERWTCHTQISSTSSAQVAGLDQRGFRTSAGAPSGVLTPQFIGERVFDSAGLKWWQAYGNANTSWA